ncbi:MAG: hypothetical protein AB8B57_14480 [Congregibacter sp.]
MSDEYQRVEPTPFDAPSTAAPSAPVAVAAARPGWLVPALAVLALLGVFVVFLLPGWVSDRPPAVPQQSQSQATANDAVSKQPRNDPQSNSDSALASPFADAVAAKARAEAQELLAELLDIQQNLTERGAESWAAEIMTAIAAEALAGDERYKERAFDTAIGHYETALADAIALEQSIPERFKQQTESARSAIEALDLDTALAAYELAQALEPGDPALGILQQRLDELPAVVTALDNASLAETDRDLDTAVAELRKAAGLDPLHQRVQSEFARLETALNEQRFNSAMSEGYAALDEGKYERAQQRFASAAKLQPGSAEAAAAQQELAVARTAATLNRLQKRGEDSLESEEWAAAIKAFEEAAAIDSSLRFAREGLAFARPRASLDKRLQAILDEPQRLVDDAILREARDTLQKTRALDKLGPSLTDKADAVAKTLAIASTPLGVQIQSDGLTEVTVYKVARLGAITERQLTLRPGKYTAVGTRRGYRDVRVEFEVSPNDRTPIYIACNESI